VAVIILLVSTSSLDAHFQDCDKIKTNVETKNPSPGKEDGEITITAEGGQGKIRYFIFKENGYPINSNNELINSVKNLKKGKYKCSVMDEAGCIKKLSIELI
jgi:hypothetical protein